MNFVDPNNAFGTSSEAQAPPRQRKWPISYGAVSGLAITGDVTGILLCGIGSGVLYSLALLGTPGEVFRYFGVATVIAVLFVSLMKSRDLYNPTELLSLKTQIRDLTAAWASVFLFLFGTLFTLKIGQEFSRISTFSFGLTGLGFLVAQRVVIRGILTKGLREQKFYGRNTILITDSSVAGNSALVPTLLKHGFHLDRQFVLALQQGEAQNEMVAEIIRYVRGSDIEEVIVSADLNHWGELRKLFSELRVLPLPVNLVPSGAASAILSRPSRTLDNALCIELQRGPLSTFEQIIKRTLDLVGAVIGLIMLLPLLTLTALMIKLDSAGPIFFRQQRCGFNGRPFNIVKFRTMTVLEDGPTIAQATKNDVRVTRLGRLLRRASIDELPQLFNVLNGTMSLVGPRPHAMVHDNHFDKLVRNYAFRHHVKPGLTGWAQIKGHRGPTPTLAEIRARVECDLWYIDNWSMWLDIKIIALTVREVLRGRNAY